MFSPYIKENNNSKLLIPVGGDDGSKIKLQKET